MCNIFKKPIALTAIFLAISISVCAQTYTDTIKPFSGSAAFRKFSFGINAGATYPAVATGGTNDYTNPEVSLGYGANLKYQMTHWLALQLDFLRGNITGNNEAPFGDETLPKPRSFETELHYAGSLNGVITFGNINWLSVRNRVVPYVSAGAGFASFDVTFNPTSNGEPNQPYVPINDKNPMREYFVQAAAGLKFSISRSMNLDLGYRMHYIDGDNFDGMVFFRPPLNPSHKLHKDKFAYGFLGLEFVLGNKAKPQLMFDNPASRMNSDLQNQIDVLRTQINLANSDTDGDGVADIFDKEPNTPAGCPVDTHGVTRDTDGDGVPDCRDKQLITPTECQPVDADGVGKCPPPECCTTMQRTDSASACNISDLPSLSLRGNSSTLSADAKAILASAASRLKESPACTITVTGYPSASKASQAVCNRRAEAVRTYLMNNEGISADRLSVSCEVGGGDANTIDLKVR